MATASACSPAMVNWSSGRYPWIVESALKNRTRQFAIDGEAVVLGVDGVSDFDALYSRQHDEQVQLYASTCWPWMAKTCAGFP